MPKKHTKQPRAKAKPSLTTSASEGSGWLQSSPQHFPVASTVPSSRHVHVLHLSSHLCKSSAALVQGTAATQNKRHM